MFSALGLSAINLSLISAVLLLTLSGINYRIDYRRDLDFGNDGCTRFFFIMMMSVCRSLERNKKVVGSLIDPASMDCI